MTRGKTADWLNLLSRLNYSRIGNLLKIFGSYYASRLVGRPAILGLPVSLSIEPTTSCNLRCPQCPSGIRSFSRPTGMLDKELFFKIIEHAHKSLFYLTFYFQGEPYLHKDFLNMAALAEKKGIYTSTSTNGIFLSREKAEATVGSGLSRLIISMDGLDQASYEKYRIGGNVEKVKEGIRNIVEAKKRLKSSRPYLILQFLAFRHNEKDTQNFRDFAKNIGADEARIKTAQIYDFENGSELIPENGSFARYATGRDGKYHLKSRQYNHCWRMWHSCVITWDGIVVPCCFDKDASHRLGNAKETSLQEIWRSDEYQNFRHTLLRSRKSVDICKNCSEGTKVWI